MISLLGTVIIIYLIISAATAVYVWNDAGRKHLRRGRWTIFALLCPAVCLIFYFLMCGEERVPCPECGYLLKQTWKFCPICSTEAPEMKEGSYKSSKRDMRMNIVLAILLIIPVLICTIAFPDFTGYSMTHYGGESAYTVKKNIKSEDIKQWFEECDAKDDDVSAYMLKQTIKSGERDYEKTDIVVVYVNEKGKYEGDIDLAGIRGKRFYKLESSESAEGEGYVFIGEFTGSDRRIIKDIVLVDGKEMEVEVETPDFDLQKAIWEGII